MLDAINQRTEPSYGNGDTRFPVDNVNGYSIKELEQALKGAKTWWQWRDNIITRYDNPTEGSLNGLFANWPN